LHPDLSVIPVRFPPDVVTFVASEASIQSCGNRVRGEGATGPNDFGIVVHVI
jgi:hypothetical protein